MWTFPPIIIFVASNTWSWLNSSTLKILDINWNQYSTRKLLGRFERPQLILSDWNRLSDWSRAKFSQNGCTRIKKTQNYLFCYSNISCNNNELHTFLNTQLHIYSNSITLYWVFPIFICTFLSFFIIVIISSSQSSSLSSLWSSSTFVF